MRRLSIHTLSICISTDSSNKKHSSLMPHVPLPVFMPSSSIHPVIKIISFLVLRMLLSSAGIGTHFIIFVFVIMPFIFIFIGFKAVAFLEV
jgi:hypothetical protein